MHNVLVVWNTPDSSTVYYGQVTEVQLARLVKVHGSYIAFQPEEVYYWFHDGDDNLLLETPVWGLAVRPEPFECTATVVVVNG